MFGFGRKRRGRLNDKGEDMGDEQDEFKRKMEALEAVGSVVGRVQKYANFLSSIPSEQQSSQQRLWLLAYAAINLKMAPGTEASLTEAALLLPILDNTIDQNDCGKEGDPDVRIQKGRPESITGATKASRGL
jgi:hypothetical protein